MKTTFFSSFEREIMKKQLHKYSVGEIWAQPGVAAQPLVSALFTLLNDVTSDDAAAVANRGFPGQRDSRLDLVTEVQIQRRARPV